MSSAQPIASVAAASDVKQRMLQSGFFLIPVSMLVAMVVLGWMDMRQRDHERAAYRLVYRAYLKDSMADLMRVDNALTTQVQKDVFEGYKTCLGTYLASRKPFPYDKDFVCAPAAVDRVTKVEPSQAKAFSDALDLHRTLYETTFSKHPGL